MTLNEFETFMEDEFGAYWTSFYIKNKNNFNLDPIPPEQLNSEIVQLDSIGLSKGNESLMIDMIVYVDEIDSPIKVCSKMLGSNRNKCFYAMREIMDRIHVSYCSVNN